MNFNKTTEYAFRILSLMAQDETRLYSVDEIYDKLRIPYRYLRKLMTNLSKGQIIRSVQGKNGGYQFSAKLDKIWLIDIVSMLDPDYLKTKCFFGFENCALQVPCVMHNQWTGLGSRITSVLSTTSLADINRNNDQNQILVNINHSLKS